VKLWFIACFLVSEKELQKLYKNFSKIDKDKSGMLEPEEFFDIPGKDRIAHISLELA